MPRKTEFELIEYRRQRNGEYAPERVGSVKIYPKRVSPAGKKLPVSIAIRNWCHEYSLKPRDLERFAVNILKALKSDKLKK